MTTKELFRTPKFDLLPETRWCNIRFGEFNALPHGPETRSVHVEIIVNISAPDDFTDENWEKVKGCAVLAGGLGVTDGVAVMISTEGKDWPATIGAFEETFSKDFTGYVVAKLSADIAKKISSKVDTEKSYGAWTHH